MTQIKHLHFGLDAYFGVTRSHSAQHVRCLDIDVIGIVEVDRAAIERRNIRPQEFNMRHTFLGTDEISPLARNLRIVVIDHQITTHTGSQIDQHISATVPDKLHGLFEEIDVPTAFAGLGITDMQMHNCCTRVRRFNGRVGNLLGGDGNRRMLIYRISCAGYRTAYDYVGIHGHLSYSS